MKLSDKDYAKIFGICPYCGNEGLKFDGKFAQCRICKQIIEA